MTIKPHTFFTFLFLLINLFSYAQSPSGTTGNWLMFTNQTRLSERFSIHIEGQYRSYEAGPNTEQVLTRAGVNFHINKTATGSLGYGYIVNYAYDKELLPGIQSVENRIWQQFTLRSSIGRVLFDHRYRLEQRWIQSKTNFRYLDRIRYALRITIPINKKEIEKNTLFISVYDELFIHFTKTPFDRNRLYGALGFQFNKNANVQLGCLAQTVNTITKPYLQIGLFYNIDLRKKE